MTRACKIEEVFFNVWFRTHPSQVVDLREQLSLPSTSPDEKLHGIVQELGPAEAIKDLVHEASRAEPIDQVAQAQAKVVHSLPPTTPAKIKAEVVDLITSTMYKGFGVKHETNCTERRRGRRVSGTIVYDEDATKMSKVSWDEKMWKRDIEPYLIIFGNALIKIAGRTTTVMGNSKAKKEEHKLRGIYIFYKFKSRPSQEQQPNFFAYNAAFFALLETNQFEKIHPLASYMKSQGMEWDVMTYQNVILSYIRGGAVETAVQILQKEAERIGKTTTCYSEAIAYYDEKRKNPREAVCK
ncbi:hypothetical protein PsorP6_017877 [Peronosclerospora sorghi]|uniref:Uncharacterized protein n=1 Tax=Peronosclerospora sorghi TaxID=230839 RepID=A0ACC0WCA3_9STRA|nr:hypothetical protein PsorP6_017877 [Peronosclerospora sorghi]